MRYCFNAVIRQLCGTRRIILSPTLLRKNGAPDTNGACRINRMNELEYQYVREFNRRSARR